MQIEFKFDIKDRVWIIDLSCYGRVVSCWYTKKGLEYEVRYFLEGKIETTYLFEDELSVEKP